MSLPLLAAGEFARVIPILEQALKTPAEWIGDHDLYAALADVAVRQRDEMALRQYAPLAEELAQRCGHRLYQAVAHRAWGVAHRLAGEYAEAASRLNQALMLFQELDTRWQLGRTWLELGELAAVQGEPTKARACFQHALGLFEAMRAAPDTDRARAALEALDISGWMVPG
jgi:tetratricopeptide (TPR) repeat protein